MERRRFDDLAIRCATSISRRPFLALVALSPLGIAALTNDEDALAKNKKNRGKKGKSKRFCLNGKGVKAKNKQKKRRLRKRGATRGRCPKCNVPCTGTPAECGAALTAALLIGGDVRLCAGRFAGSFVVSVDGTTLTGVGNGTNEKKASIVDAESSGRVFLVNPDISASFSNMRIMNALSPGIAGGGGGIAMAPNGAGVSAPASIDKCVFEANSADSAGAFGTAGPATITNSQFLNNSATNVGGAPGGGLSLFSPPAGPFATSTVSNCTFTGNTATGAGGAIFIRSQNVNASGITVEGNSADSGGGIYADSAGDPVIVNLDNKTTISGNTSNNVAVGGGIAAGAGATVNLNGATVEDNTPTNCSNVTGC